jgi:hypothetical protein
MLKDRLGDEMEHSAYYGTILFAPPPTMDHDAVCRNASPKRPAPNHLLSSDPFECPRRTRTGTFRAKGNAS